MSKVLFAEGLGYNLLTVSQLMAKGIHLEADSTTQEFKLYNGKGGLYIGKAVLKNNVFVLDFVLDQGIADSDAIVNFTTWSHPPDLDLDFGPGGFCSRPSTVGELLDGLCRAAGDHCSVADDHGARQLQLTGLGDGCAVDQEEQFDRELDGVARRPRK
ncbi:unnamed protein product [Closterium sp. NIES-53]